LNLIRRNRGSGEPFRILHKLWSSSSILRRTIDGLRLRQCSKGTPPPAHPFLFTMSKSERPESETQLAGNPERASNLLRGRRVIGPTPSTVKAFCRRGCDIFAAVPTLVFWPSTDAPTR
jgi:hypothetical protein